jgi:PAS domain S-box-containing protein
MPDNDEPRKGMPTALLELQDRFGQMEKERDLLRALINKLPDCNIFLKDEQNRFILTNAFHLKVLGVESLHEIIGKTDFDFFPRELAEQYYRDEQAVFRSGQPLINREERMVDAEGKEYWLLTTKVPLYSPEGKITGIVGLSRDITVRKKLEQERENLIQSLEEALDNIKALRGLLPICSLCKKIRDDKGYWHQVENYIHDHSGAEFSHSYCPECAEKTLAQLDREEEGE